MQDKVIRVGGVCYVPEYGPDDHRCYVVSIDQEKLDKVKEIQAWLKAVS